MAKNLSSLVHELRERIAASSSTPPLNKHNTGGDDDQYDDALEIRFRAVIPNLLHTYVVPSSTGMYFLTKFPLILYMLTLYYPCFIHFAVLILLHLLYYSVYIFLVFIG